MKTVIHSNALAAKVAAVNLANEYANELETTLRAAFAPFVGCKVVKTNGSLLESVKKTLPELPSHVGLSVYRQSATYGIAYTVKTSQGYQDRFCVYHEAAVYVGDLTGQVLSKIEDRPSTRRTDYTAEEITALREVASKARQAARDAESALSPFGEYDR